MAESRRAVEFRRQESFWWQWLPDSQQLMPLLMDHLDSLAFHRQQNQCLFLRVFDLASVLQTHAEESPNHVHFQLKLSGIEKLGIKIKLISVEEI